MTVASARALRSDMRVRVLPAAAVTATLERLAEAALTIGVSTSFLVDRDVLWVDISGIAHLYKNGEREVALRLHGLVKNLGHEGRVVIADGAYVAMVSAWYLQKHICKIVPTGRDANAQAMRALPIAALRCRRVTWSGSRGSA